MAGESPLLASFEGKTSISSADFISIFNRYDTDGNGSIDSKELEHFLDDLVKKSDVKLSVPELKTAILSTYDTNKDGKIQLEELSKILPAGENFLLRFRNEQELSSVDFMKIWYHYDSDRSGYLERNELQGFLGDLLLSNDKNITPNQIGDYCETILNLFDSNKDGKIELKELSKILPVEDNFLKKFQSLQLSDEEISKVFQHYDKDSSGSIDGTEIAALMRDILARKGIFPNTADIEMMMKSIMDVCDVNKDGMVSRKELALIFA